MFGSVSTFLVRFSLTIIAFFRVFLIWLHMFRTRLLYNHSQKLSFLVTMVYLVDFSNVLRAGSRTSVRDLRDFLRKHLTALPIIYCCKGLSATYFQGSVIHF